MPGIDPKVLLLIITLSAGYQGYERVLKPVAITVVHTTQHGLTKIGHGLRHGLRRVIP